MTTRELEVGSDDAVIVLTATEPPSLSIPAFADDDEVPDHVIVATCLVLLATNEEKFRPIMEEFISEFEDAEDENIS